MHFYRKCWFDPFEEQFISPFFSDCPSLMLGIAIHTAFSSNVGAWGMWACSLFLSFFKKFYFFCPLSVVMVGISWLMLAPRLGVLWPLSMRRGSGSWVLGWKWMGRRSTKPRPGSTRTTPWHNERGTVSKKWILYFFGWSWYQPKNDGELQQCA